MATPKKTSHTPAPKKTTHTTHPSKGAPAPSKASAHKPGEKQDFQKTQGDQQRRDTLKDSRDLQDIE